jgi:hypothetical protein
MEEKLKCILSCIIDGYIFLPFALVATPALLLKMQEWASKARCDQLTSESARALGKITLGTAGFFSVIGQIVCASQDIRGSCR